MERKNLHEALNLVSEIELVYKSKVKASERPVVTSSADCYEIFKEIWEEGKLELAEQFKVLFLNRANAVLSVYNVSSGGITGTQRRYRRRKSF